MQTEDTRLDEHSQTERMLDRISVEIAVDSDRFSQSGPLGQRLAAMIADRCRGEQFQRAAREALELPEPFSIMIAPSLQEQIAEPQIQPPEQIKAQAYCPYPTYFAWSKGCSSWPW